MAFKLSCVCLLGLIMVPNVIGLTIQTGRFFVKTKHIDLNLFNRNMEDTFNFKYKYSIVPSFLHVFEYIGNDDMYKHTSYHMKIIEYFNGKIEYIQPITVSNDVLQVDPIPVKASSNSDDKNESGSYENFLEEGQSYGMGVQEAWRQGYNGSGIVIASTDVGVDIDNPDLRDNIDTNLSYNFVSHDHRDLSPIRFTENGDSFKLPDYLTDHGNRCCGLLAAKKDNNICCAGIAYGAKIAVLKIFTVTQGANGIASNSMGYEYAAEALSHELQTIDIFSNSWVKKHAFNGLGLPMNDVLEYGIEKGRHGKGNVFVFPTGPIAEGFANSRYTITVSSIDKQGRIPAEGYVELCAAILTSVYGESVRANGEYMVTTSHQPGSCTIDFKGTSASTAMVSAIIALALQANKELSWRDVQHLVVRSSHREGLVEAKNFKTNGAGHYYHAEIGFGLLNANSIVSLAINWQNVGPEVCQKEVSNDFETKIKNKDKWSHHMHHTLSIARLTINDKSKTLVKRVEHVEVELSYKSPNEYNLEIALISPADTQSILMDVKQSTVNNATTRSNVKFLSVHFWDEQANGTWKLILKQNHYINENMDGDFGIRNFSLSIHGTNQDIEPYKDDGKLVREEQLENDENISDKKITTSVQHLPKEEGSFSWPTLVGSVVGAIVLIIVACIAIYCIKKRNNSNSVENCDQMLMSQIADND